MVGVVATISASKRSPDKICFEEGCTLEGLAPDGFRSVLPLTEHLVEGRTGHMHMLQETRSEGGR